LAVDLEEMDVLTLSLYLAGFIEFIVEPSMGVCADMLEAVLAPILGNNANKEANKDAIEEEPSGKCHPNALRSTDSLANLLHLSLCLPGDGKHKADQQRFTIKKPWVATLAENKKLWKEQAARGKWAGWAGL
jgi:hypothetical protein